MKTAIKLVAILFFGVCFWVAVDGIQAAPKADHFSFTEAKSLWGLAAWLTAVWAGQIMMTFGRRS